MAKNPAKIDVCKEAFLGLPTRACLGRRTEVCQKLRKPEGASGLLRGIAKDERRKSVELLVDRSDEIVAAIMGIDQSPEHDLVRAAAEQRLLQYSSDQSDRAGVLISIVKRLRNRLRVRNTNQNACLQIDLVRPSRGRVERALRQHRCGAAARLMDRLQRFAIERHAQRNPPVAPDPLRESQRPRE